MPPRKDNGPLKEPNDSNKRNGTHPGEVSFVSFDFNQTQEARKAVRKQAALSSAAARKATIARKIAKQKEHESSEGGAVVLGLNNVAGKENKRRRSSPEPQPPAKSVGAKGVKQQTRAVIPLGGPYSELEPVKQKRFSNCITLDESQSDLVRIYEGSGYISPEHSTHEDEEEQFSGSRLCPCLECRTVAASKPSAPWSGSNWPVLSDDYRNLESTQLMSPESLPTPYSLAASKVDPFMRYPVEYFPIFDKLFHHLLTVFAPRGWPTLKITKAEGFEWEQWMTQQGLLEPAFFYVRLLFACGDMIRVKQLDTKVADWLRSRAISTINEALNDPRRSISDGLILAVGRIALTESMYGDRNAATKLHRPAQKRMIDLRGGMDALPFPALVKKLMRWADNVMAIQTGTERILGDAKAVETETNFGVKKSVDVLEKWVPQEGRALRKKIAISDLIT